MEQLIDTLNYSTNGMLYDCQIPQTLEEYISIGTGLAGLLMAAVAFPRHI